MSLRHGHKISTHFVIYSELRASSCGLNKEFFDMSTMNDTAESQSPPVLSPDQDAVQLLLALPSRRHQRQVLDQGELKQIGKLLTEFINSPARRTAPSKAQLTVAVNALLPSIEMHVSPKFNKPQLAAVLQRWVQEALLLAPSTDQNNLYVEIKSMKSNTRKVDLTKAIYIEEDDGSVATFSISSPESAKKAQCTNGTTQPSPGLDLITAFPITPEPMDLPTFVPASTDTIGSRANGVIDEIVSLAAIGTSDPGVSSPGEETARARDLDSPRPGAHIF